jgi:hypothetical protein
MSKFRMIRVLAAVLLLVVSMVLPAAAQEGEVAVTLERTACFGACPIYKVTLYTDGTVVYEGERFVTTEGTQTTKIEPAVVQQLVEGFEAAGYFEWDDEYTQMTITDQPSVITSVTRDGETKQITRYAGDSSAPMELPYLEAWIDLAAYTGQWTGASPWLSAVSSANMPVMTLERTACFGMCPVYGVAVFEDGSVVFLGVRYVAEPGVHTTSVDPDQVEFLAMQTADFGYFEWDDEYTDMPVTDQPTAITTLRWDDEYKQITRYDGDPNAPVGLVRFENRIDALVNVEQWVGTPE